MPCVHQLTVKNTICFFTKVLTNVQKGRFKCWLALGATEYLFKITRTSYHSPPAATAAASTRHKTHIDWPNKIKNRIKMAGKIITKKWEKKDTKNMRLIISRPWKRQAWPVFSFSFNRKLSGDIHGPVVKRHGGEIGTHGNNSRPVCPFFF